MNRELNRTQYTYLSKNQVPNPQAPHYGLCTRETKIRGEAQPPAGKMGGMDPKPKRELVVGNWG